MESIMPVNEILKDEITKLDHTLTPPGFHGDEHSVRVMRECLSKIINNLGEQSSTTQGLRRIITTANQLCKDSTQILYLLKDSNAKGGKGEVIGLLRVAYKCLYLYDKYYQPQKVEPLCVLDFFVLEDYQRQGRGQMLFDYMLQDMKVTPDKLAVDGPSSKMEKFLNKNYGIEKLTLQNNNFGIAPQFFDVDDDISDGSKSGRSSPFLRPNIGRYAARKPPSVIATVIHGEGCHHLGFKTPQVSVQQRAFYYFANSFIIFCFIPCEHYVLVDYSYSRIQHVMDSL